MPQIAIIDYEVSNLRSVEKAFQKLGFKAVITNDSKVILSAGGVVLPGVGAFDPAVKSLKKLKLADAVKTAIKSGKPFLGICLGLQILFSKSEEGKLPGLNIFPGKIKHFKLKDLNLKVPHMGWNQLNLQLTTYNLQLFKNIPKAAFFYFVHSYHAVPKDKSIIAATTEYGIEFVSAIAKDNVFGVQFHPEKSGEVGLQVLRNFGEMCK